MDDAPKPKADRSLAIDAVKGVGILQVVVHHSLGQSDELFAKKGDWAWYLMRGTAWATNFAIPLFLLLGAMLLAGSLAKRPEAGRFLWRRLSRTLWPYLVWTAFYLILSAATIHFSGPWLINLEKLLDPEKLQRAVLWGKASYHLYFMVILLQFSLAVPLLLAVLKRVRMSFWTVLSLAVALQFGAFMLQKHVLRSSYPATLLLWYVVPLVVGVWMGLEKERWREVANRWGVAFLLVGFFTGWMFTAMNVDSELGQPWNGNLYNWISVIFRTSASLALIWMSTGLGNLRIGPLLAALGRYSLPIYLVHPAVLRLFGGPRPTALFASLPIPVLWVVFVVTAISCLFAWLCSLLRLDLILFGQSLPRQQKA